MEQETYIDGMDSVEQELLLSTLNKSATLGKDRGQSPVHLLSWRSEEEEGLVVQERMGWEHWLPVCPINCSSQVYSPEKHRIKRSAAHISTALRKDMG